jgi:spore coat protein A
LPGLCTTIWGYEGILPGPTIHASRGRRVVVHHTNRLAVPTVVHLHGGVTPPDSDGFPTDMILPDQTRTYVYLNNQHAATLWYHDHAMDHTGRNIYMGLAGFYLLRDQEETSLHLPEGPYDVPLLIQDRLFAADGQFVYDTFRHLAAKGSTILVNGAPWPRMEVAARKYRFRILNGSNATPLGSR